MFSAKKDNRHFTTILTGGKYMSWISDVHDEIKNLDISTKSLRKFGLSVGAVFCLLALWMFLRNRFPLALTILGIVGVLLIVMGLIVPKALNEIYRVWMGMAFAIGWVVSRILLSMVFFLVITPIGFIARLFGKEFMDIETNRANDSYWVRRNKSKKINYEKMY
jgi:CBS domain containing-hemolysin-like protein